jgi:hypothetical protein
MDRELYFLLGTFTRGYHKGIPEVLSHKAAVEWLTLLLSRSRLCYFSVGGAWWHLCFYESFQYPVRVISPATGVESEGVNMTE